MGQNTGYKKLTPKQEKFCQLVASGKNQTDAYREAYDCSRKKPETVWRKAKEVMDNGKVSARISELGQPALEKCSVTIEGIIEDLKRLAEKAEQADRYTEAIKARELLGKYLKMFTEKVQHSGDVNHTFGWAE